MIKLYNMDCMEAMAEMKDKEFDLCLTDPPYGIGFQYNSYNDTEENWLNLMVKFIPEAIRIAEMVIMPCCQIKKLDWIYNNFPPDWLICWHKGSTGHCAYVGFNDWEPHLVYGKIKGLQIHDYFSLSPTFQKDHIKHPCPKPIGWAKWFLKRCIKKGMKVIDQFLGSGTTAIACHDLGFELIGYEIDTDYYNAACERLKRHQSQLRMF